jgi:preprotein translocase subunit SecE
MADDDGPEDRSPKQAPLSEKASFFTVYKKGQGVYTRYGTAAGAALLIIVLGLFIYDQSNAVIQQYNPQAGRAIPAAITAAVVAIGAIVAWRIMNAPNSANFLISTDSEMKKVSWPSREELIGSTRIVILFLFVIALLLFLIDVGTGLLFQIIGLLKFGLLS